MNICHGQDCKDRPYTVGTNKRTGRKHRLYAFVGYDGATYCLKCAIGMNIVSAEEVQEVIDDGTRFTKGAVERIVEDVEETYINPS